VSLGADEGAKHCTRLRRAFGYQVQDLYVPTTCNLDGSIVQLSGKEVEAGPVFEDRTSSICINKMETTQSLLERPLLASFVLEP
jgi:hypothetical protein